MLTIGGSLPAANVGDLVESVAFGDQTHRFRRGHCLLSGRRRGPGAFLELSQRRQDLSAVQLGFAFADSGNTEKIGD